MEQPFKSVCAADKIILVNAVNGADLNAGAAAGAKRVINGCQIVFYRNGTVGASLLALHTAYTTVGAVFACECAFVVIGTFYSYTYGISYKMNEMELHSGDRIFLYTDGVTEAMSAANELFGEDRLEAVLNSLQEKMVEVECIARGYLTGSGWKEYQKQGTVNGQRLREGYQNASKLDEVLFTPTTKAAIGDHDEAIDYAQTEALVGADMAAKLKEATISLYTRAAEYARERGIIIADTKFEFGMDDDGSLILADEVLTPDSSRFWPESSYAVGSNPPSLDKQYVRDWLDSINFNHQPPGPELPDEVIGRTREIYIKAYEDLSGRKI